MPPVFSPFVSDFFFFILVVTTSTTIMICISTTCHPRFLSVRKPMDNAIKYGEHIRLGLFLLFCNISLFQTPEIIIFYDGRILFVRAYCVEISILNNNVAKMPSLLCTTYCMFMKGSWSVRR